MGRARARHKVARPAAEAARPEAAGGRLPLLPLAAVLALVTLLAYSNSFTAALTMDSPTLIERDTRLREASSASLHEIWTRNYWWPSRPSNLFRPVTTTSYLVNYSILGNGPAPLGYHVVNFLLHALDVFLAYELVRRLAGDRLTALLAAALFAVHPVATESVTNVVGRADLFAAASVLGGLILHIESRRRANPWPWRLALWLTALAGVFAKEAAVVVLPAVVLYDLWFPPSADGEKAGGMPWLSYSGLGVVLAVLFLVRRAALADMGYYHDHFLDNPLFGLSFVASSLTALRVMVKQLLLLVFPWRLSCDYSYDAIPLFSRAGTAEDVKTVACALLVTALVALALALRKRAPVVSFFVLLYFGTLFPTSNLTLRIGSIMAERFLYLPMVAFAAVVALGLRAAAARIARTPDAAPRLALSATGALVLALATRTYVRNHDWRSEEALFRAATAVSPGSYKAHKGLANALLADKNAAARLDEAIAAAEAGLRVIEAKPLPPVDQPSDLMAVVGLAYVTKGDSLGGGRMGVAAPEAAAVWYRRAVAVLERAVETDRAVSARVRALKLASGVPAAEVYDVGLRRVHGTLGNAQVRLGRYADALQSFAYLRHLDPGRADGYTQAAWALAQWGHAEEAAVMLIEAYVLEESPNVVPLLREVYQAVDPQIVPFAENGALNLGDPRVRAGVDRACAGLVSEYTQSGRALGARDIREVCVGRYQTSPSALPAP
jgi:protein O-mannosyl-transferase